MAVALVAGTAFAATDLLDTNLTVRVALGQVERSLFCKASDGWDNRNRILRTIGEIERLLQYGPIPSWAVRDIAGQREASYAYALLRQHAGTLYGRGEYAASGRSDAERLISDNGGREPEFRKAEELPSAVRDYYEIMRLNRADLRSTIRPGGRDGRPFWNGCSPVFTYPPAFDFKDVSGVTDYRFVVIDDLHARHTFTASSPKESLASVWAELPAGPTTVICRGVDEKGNVVGIAGERTFWRNAPFDPSEYPTAKRSVSEAHRKGFEYLLNLPGVLYLEKHGVPDVASGDNFSNYPSKMQAAVIETMIAGAKRFPECRERAMAIARKSADYLLSTAQPKGAPLEHFTATYAGEWFISRVYAGQNMLVYPSEAGRAFLRLYQAGGERKYLDAAANIAATYLKLQREDGSWYLKMWEKDGKPVDANRLIPTHVIDFLEEMYAETHDERYRRAADRGFATIDNGPLKTWNWEGQFEDQEPQRVLYQNLTKHGACETAIYLLKRFPGDARRLAEARDIVRFAEDQFVMWKSPCRMSGAGLWRPMYPFFAWRTPAALEQYRCYAPIDASAAKLIKTYMALYAAECNPLDLAKAKALGASMVNNQDENGRIRTYWIPEPGDADDPTADAIRVPLGGDWFNCMTSDLQALELLED